MAHKTIREGYRNLVERLNRFPQGVVPSKRLYDILELLFTQREAELVALLPLRPFRAKRAAAAWHMPLKEAKTILDSLASRAILVDFDQDGEMIYTLPPPMAGFFEFSMMRTRGDIDQKLLANLYYEYMNVEEDFIKTLFTNGETQLGRVFVHEPVLTNEQALHVLDYERASQVIENAKTVAVGMCYCRHKMSHLGRACSAPMNICMTFGATGASLIRHGYAKEIESKEGMEMLQEAYEANLVQFGENVQNGVHFICHCCQCCCEAMIAARRFGFLNPIHTTNFLPTVTPACSGCGHCLKVCPVEALTFEEDTLQVDENRCLGCGVCARACPIGAIELCERAHRVLTPINTTHRVVSMAIERGTLQQLLFDDQVQMSHRALAAIFGVILKLPPVKQALASEQIKSRYLGKLIECLEY